ncbi:hypothetical protein SAMN05216266_11582 [Amycolatopsis marina]|uniref:Ligand-binding SRPBCC domain-containing protein n=1 Tax=Amycolatopsis marina TaxID=490629 RepID=A0A1I1BST3_9PSEU|nr:hypothetical protein SAMN05216266_11582 [Amycolatopsis marina]
MRIQTELAVPVEPLWAHVTSFTGINDELRPLLRMTKPSRLDTGGLLDLTPPAELGKSVLLAFGVLPVDYDDIGIVEFEPSHRFLERSRMLSAVHWEHERVLTPTERGCLLADRVEFEPRFAVTGAVLRTVVPRLFRHRHARLARRFGRCSPPQKPL